MNRPCPICTSDKARTVFRSFDPDGNVVECQFCGLIYADTAKTQAEYDQLYAERSKYADPAHSTGGGNERWEKVRFDQTAAEIAGFEPNRDASILDIDCAMGGLIRSLQDRGFRNGLGMEPSPACAAAVKGVLGSPSNPPAALPLFDGIILSHVLEHVRDLRNELQAVRGLLKPGGWLYVEVPDASRYKDFLFAPFQDFNVEHINHFDAFTLLQLLRANGFFATTPTPKVIQSSAEFQYPAISSFAGRSKMGVVTLPVQCEGPSVEIAEYVGRSNVLLADILAKVERRSKARTLSFGVLARSVLNFFAIRVQDGEANSAGGLQSASGMTHPSKISEMNPDGPILVASIINRAPILADIERYGLKNPVITLP